MSEESGSYRDAKAQAKAAKAYAKAQRPWWKKKRYIFSIGIVLLIIVVAAGSSGGSDSGGSGGSGGSGSKQTADEGKSGSVGDALTNAGTTYKVTSAKTATAIGDPDIGGAKADGTFVIADLELTNNKDETKTFTESSAKVVTADGKEYKTSDKAELAFGDDSLLLRDIQPDLTAKGKLAFDIPPSKTSGAKLVIEDLWGDGEIAVDLGL